MHHSKNVLDLDGFHAKILGQTDNIDTQIAALVQCIGERRRNEPVCRFGKVSVICSATCSLNEIRLAVT